LRVSSTLPRTNSLICPLITSSFSCTIFSDMVCLLLQNGLLRLHSNRVYKPCLPFLFKFAQLILPYLPPVHVTHWQSMA
jgi:hypothetical protein